MSSQLSPALHVLRAELTPLAVDQHALHALALLPLAHSTEDLARRCNWPGSLAQARTALLYDLRSMSRVKSLRAFIAITNRAALAHIPPAMMIPHRRLHQLIKQAAELQTKKCVYHNTASAQLYLFEDHFCDRHELPSQALHVLDQRDEVWYLQFSRKGKHFVSAGKDGRCLIWEVSSLNEEKPMRVLNHHHPISYAAWSPADTHLLTCSDGSVKVWSVQSGECHVSVKNTSREAFTCCTWLNDATNRFLVGGLDGKISLYVSPISVSRSSANDPSRAVAEWHFVAAVDDIAHQRPVGDSRRQHVDRSHAKQVRAVVGLEGHVERGAGDGRGRHER